MTAKTVSITISDDLRPGLDEVVGRFANGNRSEFLRLAVREYHRRLRFEQLHALRESARAERSGRRYSTDEIMALVRSTATS